MTNRRLHLLILMLLAAGTYMNALRGEFVFDDIPILQHVHPVTKIADIFVSEPRPLVMVSYKATDYFFGTNVVAWHATSILLHLAAVVFVYLLLLDLSFMDSAALMGAAVFAVHPLWGPAVGSIAGRSSLMCGLFYFAALFIGLRAVQEGRVAKRWALYFLGFLSSAAAFASKQEAATLPFVFIAFLWIRSDWKLSFRSTWVGAVALIAAGGVDFVAARAQSWSAYLSNAANDPNLVEGGFEAGLPIGVHIPTYISALVRHYYLNMVFPAGIAPDPDVTVTRWFEVSFAICLVVLLAFAALMLRRSTDKGIRYGLAGLLISPLSAHVVAPSADIVMNHRAYIAGLGVAFLVAAITGKLRRERPLVMASCVAVVAGLSLLTFQQNRMWSTGFSLWNEAARAAPDKPRPHLNLGHEFHMRGLASEAEREFRTAVRLKPDLWAARSNLGSLYVEQGRYEEAEQELKLSTERQPALFSAWMNLGVLWLRENKFQEALAAIDRAIAIEPGSYLAWLNRGEILEKMGLDATPSYRQARTLHSHGVPIH